MTLFVFVVKHLAVLLVLLIAAAGAGRLAVGSRFRLPVRAALGLALLAQALFLLAAVGQLHTIPILGLIIVAVVGGARPRNAAVSAAGQAASSPPFGNAGLGRRRSRPERHAADGLKPPLPCIALLFAGCFLLAPFPPP